MKTDTINTLEFWEKVKEEYGGRESEKYFMCWESNTFKDRWNTDANEKKELEILGEEFLKYNVSDMFKIIPSSSGLFQIKDEVVFTDDVLDTNKKQIRIDFINWNIERLKK